MTPTEVNRIVLLSYKDECTNTQGESSYKTNLLFFSLRRYVPTNLLVLSTEYSINHQHTLNVIPTSCLANFSGQWRSSATHHRLVRQGLKYVQHEQIYSHLLSSTHIKHFSPLISITSARLLCKYFSYECWFVKPLKAVLDYNSLKSINQMLPRLTRQAGKHIRKLICIEWRILTTATTSCHWKWSEDWE